MLEYYFFDFFQLLDGFNAHIYNADIYATLISSDATIVSFVGEDSRKND